MMLKIVIITKDWNTMVNNVHLSVGVLNSLFKIAVFARLARTASSLSQLLLAQSYVTKKGSLG